MASANCARRCLNVAAFQEGRPSNWPYAAIGRSRTCSSSRRNSGCGARHMVRYVSRKGSQIWGRPLAIPPAVFPIWWVSVVSANGLHEQFETRKLKSPRFVGFLSFEALETSRGPCEFEKPRPPLIQPNPTQVTRRSMAASLENQDFCKEAGRSLWVRRRA